MGYGYLLKLEAKKRRDRFGGQMLVAATSTTQGYAAVFDIALLVA